MGSQMFAESKRRTEHSSRPRLGSDSDSDPLIGDQIPDGKPAIASFARSKIALALLWLLSLVLTSAWTYTTYAEPSNYGSLARGYSTDLGR